MDTYCIPGVTSVFLVGASKSVPENFFFDVPSGPMPAEIWLGGEPGVPDKTGDGVLAGVEKIIFEVGEPTGDKSEPATFGPPNVARRTALDFAARAIRVPSWRIGDNPYGHFWSLFMPGEDVFWLSTGHVHAVDANLELKTSATGSFLPNLDVQAEHALLFAAAGRGIGVRMQAGTYSTTTTDFSLVLHELAVTSRAPATVHKYLDVATAGLQIPETTTVPTVAGENGEIRMVLDSAEYRLYVCVGTTWKRTSVLA